MPNLFRRLLDVLAGSTQADPRRQIQYLKAENEVLCSKIDRPVRVTPRERPRLVLGLTTETGWGYARRIKLPQGALVNLLTYR